MKSSIHKKTSGAFVAGAGVGAATGAGGGRAVTGTAGFLNSAGPCGRAVGTGPILGEGTVGGERTRGAATGFAATTGAGGCSGGPFDRSESLPFGFGLGGSGCGLFGGSGGAAFQMAPLSDHGLLDGGAESEPKKAETSGSFSAALSTMRTRCFGFTGFLTFGVGSRSSSETSAGLVRCRCARFRCGRTGAGDSSSLSGATFLRLRGLYAKFEEPSESLDIFCVHML